MYFVFFFKVDTKRCNCARAMFCINLEKKTKYIFRTFRVKVSGGIHWQFFDFQMKSVFNWHHCNIQIFTEPLVWCHNNEYSITRHNSATDMISSSDECSGHLQVISYFSNKLCSIQFCSMNVIPLLSKPYVNGVSLMRKNLSLKWFQSLE